MKFSFIADLENHLIETTAATELVITTEICPPNMTGDLTINCFRLAKPLRLSPDKIAETVVAFFSSHNDIINVEKIKAFVNITVAPSTIYRDTISSVETLLTSAALPKEKQRKILIEFSAPNTNKPQHLGHVRNNTIGMAITSLLKRVNHDVSPVNLVNDRGIHICKSMIAYQRFGEGKTPESEQMKGDHFVGHFYVLYNNELTKQITDLKAKRPDLENVKNDDLFLQTEIGAATQEMLLKWEANDPEVRELWKLMNSWVFEGFNETYKRMGIEFVHTYLESETYLLGKDIIQEGLDKGVLFKREDGPVVIDLGKMGEKVVLRSDGTSVYITQDIGTTLKKQNDFNPDQQIWVVGDEQILHFKMLFEILKKMGYEWADKLYHLAYGMVNLPSGKMKSREGTVVDADDLFDEMHTLAKKSTVERLKEGAEMPDDLEERSEIIGMGALKFMLLKFNPKTTIMFDPKESLKFEGDTGPYVQYACARINSIMNKATAQGIDYENATVDWSLLQSDFEKSVAVKAAFYPQTLQAAAEKMDCSIIVNYLLDLAKAFNRFYRECPVLVAESPELIVARLNVCLAVRDILVDGLKTLTIDVPKAM